MNDCVWEAYCAHLHYLDLRPHLLEKLRYWYWKGYYHGSLTCPFYGGLVEPMLTFFSSSHHLLTARQWGIWTPEHYLASAPNRRIRQLLKSILPGQRLVYDAYQGSNRIYFQPAVYLLLQDHHAVFERRVPQFGTPVLAVKFRKEHSYERYT